MSSTGPAVPQLQTRDIIAVLLIVFAGFGMVSGALSGSQAITVALGVGTAYGLVTRRAEAKVRARWLRAQARSDESDDH